MSIVDEILRDIPTDQLAQQLGTDPRTAEAAARNAIPALIAGMQHNAGDMGGEQSLAGALMQHQNSPLADDGMVDLSQVDTADGRKIVSHVFGSNEPAVINTLAGHQQFGGANGGGLIQKMLPILAPIVLAYLARKITGGAGGGLLDSILGGALGGGQMGGMQQRQGQGGMFGGGGLGDLLGGMLGGGGLGGMFGGADPAAAGGSASGMGNGGGFGGLGDMFGGNNSMDASGSASAGVGDQPVVTSAPTMDSGDSPFNTEPVSGQGGQPQTMDIGEPTQTEYADQQQPQQSQGGLMDALGSIFRGGR